MLCANCLSTVLRCNMSTSCLWPITLKTGDIVPCSRCAACIRRRVAGWSFRLMQEFKVSNSAHFITLTYSNAHVPVTRNKLLSLDKRDVQLFLKRLRKAHMFSYRLSNYKTVSTIHPGEKPLKYFLCGEYGENTERPHYHMILFNANQDLIQPAWPKGGVHYGEVTEASITYTLKYMQKQTSFPYDHGEMEDRLKQFSLMSKGLGKSYLSNAVRKYHLSDVTNNVFCTRDGGEKIAMPRYFKDKIFTAEQKAQIARVCEIEGVERSLIQDEIGFQTYGHDYLRMVDEAIELQKTKLYRDAKKQRKQF